MLIEAKDFLDRSLKMGIPVDFFKSTFHRITQDILPINVEIAANRTHYFVLDEEEKHLRFCVATKDMVESNTTLVHTEAFKLLKEIAH